MTGERMSECDDVVSSNKRRASIEPDGEKTDGVSTDGCEAGAPKKRRLLDSEGTAPERKTSKDKHVRRTSCGVGAVLDSGAADSYRDDMLCGGGDPAIDDPFGDSSGDDIFGDVGPDRGRVRAANLPLVPLPQLIPDTLPEEVGEYDFETYLKDALDRAVANGEKCPTDFIKRCGPSAHRMMYLLNLMKAADASGATFAAAKSAFGDGVCGIVDAHEMATHCRTDTIRSMCLSLEAATRRQADCDLWKVLRKGLMTASVVKWIGGRPDADSTSWFFKSASDACSRWAAPSVAFGKVNESQVRAAIAAYRLGPGYASTPDGLTPESAPRDGGERKEESVFLFDEEAVDNAAHFSAVDSYACGLLIDPVTCMLGASMDFLVCDRDNFGAMRPHPLENTLQIYEIKCRSKYLFEPDDRSETAACYERLMRERSPGAFRRFMYSCRNPGVEYFDDSDGEGKATCREALITSHEDWRVLLKPAGVTAPRKKAVKIKTRSPGEESIRRHMQLNKCALGSEVWLFGDPEAEDCSVAPVRWCDGNFVLTAPLFANPRHPNFKQIAVQTYVLSRFYGGKKIESYLATFIGRRRRLSEIGKSYSLQPEESDLTDRDLASRLGLYTITAEQAIPVLLILTPVLIDEDAFGALEAAGYRSFSAAVDALWDRARRQ